MSKTSEGNVEEEIEDLLPKKTVREVKKRPLVYLIMSVVVIIIVIGLSVGLALANKSLKEQRNIVSGLNLDLQKKGNELTALQDNLSRTEEGRKQLEQAKSQVEAENQQLDTRATSAEQAASKAKSDLAKTQANLSAKQALLASTNDQLSKAQRGVALFDQAKGLFDTFDTNSRSIVDAILSWDTDISNGNYSTGDYWNGIVNSSAGKAVKARDDITSLFNRIKSGNY